MDKSILWYKNRIESESDKDRDKTHKEDENGETEEKAGNIFTRTYYRVSSALSRSLSPMRSKCNSRTVDDAADIIFSSLDLFCSSLVF